MYNVKKNAFAFNITHHRKSFFKKYYQNVTAFEWIQNCIIINILIVCAVLALDSWSYGSGEEGPTAQHILKIVQSSLYSCIMYIYEI